MQNDNVVDRYLSVLMDLNLPVFGWVATKTRISSEKRDVRVALTGGFAKVAFSIFHKEFPIVLVVSDEVRDVLTQKTEPKFFARAQFHRTAANKKSAAAALADLPTIDAAPIAEAEAIPVTTDDGVSTQHHLNFNSNFVLSESTSLSIETDKVSQKLIEQLHTNAEEELRLEELRRTKARLKDKFDSFDWTTVGFGEAQEGTIGNYTFYFGPAKSLEGKFFYKINGVRCRDKENRNTLQDAKDAAFESFWLVLQAKDSLKKKQEKLNEQRTNS